MADAFFSDMVSPRFNPAAVLDISRKGKILIISDFHMGEGGRGDDLEFHGPLLAAFLERYYLKHDWFLILNGDIEELQRYSLKKIQARWRDLYRLFDRFAEQGRLFKTLGNHDAELLFEKNYPYPVYNAIRVETGFIPIFIYHGHQSSKVYTDYNHLIRASLRYLLKPIGIRNISSARSPRRRFFVEKQAYAFSLRHNCVSIIGHTHRALFESLGRFDFIKYEIERLCRDYTVSPSPARERIRDEVKALRVDLGKLKRSERRDVLRESLYGDDLPVPCLFNSGSAIGRKGINAIELDGETIALVYWFAQGASRKFINRGWYPLERLGDTPYCRAVLNHDRMDYINARIELLGNNDTENR
ncbi:MAG: metallophosphoesterase [Treponema sp.]|jgi:predicted phosphodiesterase|nr:metallophosphoesterase [Treponema sp.]